MNRALHSFAADAQPHVSALPERESLPLEEALELLLQRTPTVAESEEVPLFDADGRICFAHMRAELPQPPYNRVQVDGYALRSSDIASATAERPAMLLVTQHLYAGDAPGQPLEPGQAARVTTGAVLPPGADCVVWQEDTLADGQTVVISRSLAAMRNCRMCGQDMERGSTLAESGDVLHSGTLSLLAGQGHTHVRVFRRPRVSLLATGSELVLPGAPLPQGGVYNISSTLLGVRLRKMGTRILRMMTRGDNRQALQELLAEMLAESDLVITTGGASVGPKDLVPGIASEIVAEQGGSMLFQSLRLKPGSMTLAAALPQTLLDRQHVQLTAHHGFSFKFLLLEKLRHILGIYRNHVVWKNVLSHVKPEFGHLGQYSTFLCNFVIQNYVKAADTVCCNHDQTVSIVIDLTYFTFFDWF